MRRLLALLAVLALPAAALAQSPAPIGMEFTILDLEETVLPIEGQVLDLLATVEDLGGAVRPIEEVVEEPGTLRVVSAAGGPGPALAADIAVELVLDASGSMLQRLADGQRRIEVARTVLSETVRDTLPAGIPFALRVFGIEEGSCQTDLYMPLQPLDPGAALDVVAGIQALNQAKTPIGASLAKVAEDLAAAGEQRIVVLITDGEETCGGDPAAAVEALAGSGFDVRVNIVGFAIDDAALARQFEAWAALGGGTYLDAGDAEGLGAALREALRPPFHVLDGAGSQVAKGIVDGPPVTLPAGSYTIEVRSAPPQMLGPLTVEGDTETVARLVP